MYLVSVRLLNGEAVDSEKYAKTEERRRSRKYEMKHKENNKIITEEKEQK